MSLKVRDIVYKKRISTYREVAEILIEQIDYELKQETNAGFTGKEKQNIKRRVYDALNVLIAANVLKKKQKTVYCDDDIEMPGIT